MPKLPNFTRGTKGKDESRSSVKEVLTSKPRAVIKTDHSLGHYDLSRQGSNYNIAAPSGRNLIPAYVTMTVASATLSAHHGAIIRIVDPNERFCVFQFDQSARTNDGAKDPSNSDRIPIGLLGLSTDVEIAFQIKTTIDNAVHVQGYLADIDYTVMTLAADRSSPPSVTIQTAAPFVGSSISLPYTNYGAFNVVYAAGGGGSGLTAGSLIPGANGDEIIQPPFSLSSKILRGSW